MYYNYHGIAKRLILDGKLKGYRFVDSYNGISPALVLYFEGHSPMPIRDYAWEQYIDLLIAYTDDSRTPIKKEDKK